MENFNLFPEEEKEEAQKKSKCLSRNIYKHLPQALTTHCALCHTPFKATLQQMKNKHAYCSEQCILDGFDKNKQLSFVEIQE